jgi:hypothetical protein
MHFIEDRVIEVKVLAAALARPVEVWIDDCTFGHERRAIALVESQVVSRLHLVSEKRGVPL